MRWGDLQQLKSERFILHESLKYTGKYIKCMLKFPETYENSKIAEKLCSENFYNKFIQNATNRHYSTIPQFFELLKMSIFMRIDYLLLVLK